jgi:hypothetical protein
MIGLVIKVPKDDWRFAKGSPFRKSFWAKPWVYLFIPLKGKSFDPDGVTPCKSLKIDEDQIGVVTIADFAGIEQRGNVAMDLRFVVDVAMKDDLGHSVRTTPQQLIRSGMMGYYVGKLFDTPEIQGILDS